MLQRSHLSFQPLVLVAHRTAQDVIGAQLIQNRSPDMLLGKGFKKNTPQRIKSVRCIYQTNHGRTQQILLIKMCRQLRHDPADKVLYQRHMLKDQLVSAFIARSNYGL